MKGVFAVTLVSFLLELTGSTLPLHQSRNPLQTTENGALSGAHRRYLFNSATDGSSSSTDSSHVIHHSVQCGDHRCYHGRCNRHHECRYGHCDYVYDCLCDHDYEGHSCELQRVSLQDCRDSDVRCAHGECVMNIFDSIYSCYCWRHYTGKLCDLNIEYEYHCNSSCQHGDCVSGLFTSEYFCNCYDGYAGKYCDRNTASTTTSTVTSSTSTAASSSIAPSSPLVSQSLSTPETMVPTTKSTSLPTTSSTLTQTTSETVTISETSPILSTTAASPATTTVKIHFYKCDVLHTVLDLGNQAAINNTNTTSCPSGSFATPEAFVLGHCYTGMPPTWTKGASVMSECHTIPRYTPVATFVNTTYNPMDGPSGIFLGCLPNGFKLGAQPCDGVPNILHVENGGMLTMNPNLYYTVQ